MENLIWVKNAEYINDYKIEIQFNTGEVSVINFEEYLDKGIFSALKDVEFFKNFSLNSWTIEWKNGADFSPEFLYAIFKEAEMVN